MIAVLLSHENHPVSQRAMASRNDATALAFALDWVGADNVRAMSAGKMPNIAAREFLAQGIGEIEFFAAPNNLVDALTAPCTDAQWVVCGVQTTHGSGMLPYQIAHALNRPLIDRVVSVRVDGDALHVEQALAKGARRHLTLTSPAVLTIDAKVDVVPRFAAQAAARGKIIEHGAVEYIAVERANWLDVKKNARTLLKAQVKKSGHSRMLSAIGDAGSERKTQVIQSGDASDKARAVLDYLKNNGLFNPT